MSRTFLTPLVLPADPTNPLEAATKAYVDASSGGGGGTGVKLSALTVLTGAGAATGDQMEVLDVSDTTDTNAGAAGANKRMTLAELVIFLNANGITIVAASETVAGKVELATAAETLTGTDNARAVHPAGAFATFASKSCLINAQTGTTYTLALTDADKMITLSNAAAITLTVPLNSVIAFPIGTTIDLVQIGAGQVTVTQSGGVTVNATPSKLFRAQFSAATLVKYATDTWILAGDLA